MSESGDRMRVAFVTGCARSGTSILGELIGAHPEVEYRHELHHVWAKAGDGERGSHRLTAEYTTPKVVRSIRRRLQPSRPGDALVVEKNPRTMLRVPFVRAVFPEARFIHIVRDGRDVACSLMPGVGGHEWHHLKPPNWQELLQHDAGIVRCAKLWRAVLEIALADLQDAPCLTVRYEDLVADPLAVAAEALRFLELPDSPAISAFCDRIQDRTDGSYQPEKQRKWFRPDHEARVGRWRQNLTADDLRAVEEVQRPLLLRFGYEPAMVSEARP